MPQVNEMTLNMSDVVMLADEIQYGGDLLFQVKANRDAVYRELVRRGLYAQRSSIGNQQLDPRYTAEGRGPDLGLGNAYRTHFTRLYEVAVRW